MRPTLAIRAETWEGLLHALTLDPETGGFMLAGWDADADELTLFGRGLHWVPEEHYVERTRTSLIIASPGYVPFLGAAADDGAVPIFVHTHPGGSAAPSDRDDVVEIALREPALLRSRAPYYASLIVGGSVDHPTFTGRIYDGDGQIGRIERLRVIGNRIRLLHEEGAEDAEIDDEIFNRQVLAFGEEGQRLLARLRVGVVGAGGTGSAIFEQLTRQGVRYLTVIDDDKVTSTNLTRIHESGRNDIDEPKVEVMERAAERIGLGTSVTPKEGKITNEEVARHLRHLDVIFGCTDDERGRNVLAKLAVSHLIPVFDMAFVVDPSADGSIRGLTGRVTTLLPGAACLLCRGRITPIGLAAEALDREERARRAEEGYVPGLDDPDPAVGTYTTMVSTHAINELLDRLFGYSEGSGKWGATEQLLLLHERATSFNSRPPRQGHWCADPDNYGRGGSAQF